ncbi:hypothetical protein NKI12_14315 [Mesorhizobium australicum]|uniref:Uncharacterized protein n=1 Tax=Mesorhizobium australicum TaxID=536018 RepID=A0ACC6T0J0_9HYPH
MREQDEVAILDAMAELSHLENRASRDEAIRVALAQMCAGGTVPRSAGRQAGRRPGGGCAVAGSDATLSNLSALQALTGDDARA